MKYLKSILSVTLVIAMLVSVVPAAFAASISKDGADVAIEQYIAALDEQDWSRIIDLSPYDEYEENVAFYYDGENEAASIGFHSVIAASLSTLIELNSSELYNYTNADYYFEKYGNIAVYLIGVNLSVDKESKYFYNGVNFFLVTLGQEDEEWKIVLFSQAPASMIEEYVNTVQPLSADSTDNAYADSNDVEKALNIIRARYQGIILDSEGNVIETNIASAEELAAENGKDVSEIENASSTYSVTNLTRPSTISVYITSTGKIEDVEFYDYCKNVLPNEWYGSWKTEALKAGAQAVKFVGWYRVYNAKYPNKGYDVKDSSVDQVYIAGTEYSTCTSAINAVGGIGMLNSAGELFYPAYSAGTSGSAGTKSGGSMSQHGSQYLAKQGYTYDNILSYYYSNSSVSTGKLTSFSY